MPKGRKGKTNRQKQKAREQRLTEQIHKPCPGCGVSTVKISGCNYIKCVNPNIENKCGTEWCYLCGLKKTECGDETHNSH